MHSDHVKYNIRVVGCPKCNVTPEEDFREPMTEEKHQELDKVLANCPVLKHTPLPWAIGKVEEGA